MLVITFCGMAESSDYTPDPEEAVRMGSHYGPGGPVEAVFAWLELVKDGDFAIAWSRMDANLRLCRAQAWLWNNRNDTDVAAVDMEVEAERMAAVPSTSSLWSSFAITELDQLHQTWPHRFKALTEGRLGAGSATRVLGPDLEIVLLVEGDGQPEVFDKPTMVDAMVFTVRITGDGWKLAAYTDFIPLPGWPPQFESSG